MHTIGAVTSPAATRRSDAASEDPLRGLARFTHTSVQDTVLSASPQVRAMITTEPRDNLRTAHAPGPAHGGGGQGDATGQRPAPSGRRPWQRLPRCAGGRRVGPPGRRRPATASCGRRRGASAGPSAARASTSDRCEALGPAWAAGLGRDLTPPAARRRGIGSGAEGSHPRHARRVDAIDGDDAGRVKGSRAAGGPADAGCLRTAAGRSNPTAGRLWSVFARAGARPAITGTGEVGDARIGSR